MTYLATENPLNFLFIGRSKAKAQTCSGVGLSNVGLILVSKLASKTKAFTGALLYFPHGSALTKINPSGGS